MVCSGFFILPLRGWVGKLGYIAALGGEGEPTLLRISPVARIICLNSKSGHSLCFSASLLAVRLAPGTSWVHFSSVQFSSVAQSCPTLCNPMNRSTPGLPVHHQLPEFTQTHVHQVGDTIQPSHPLSSPSPPAPNPSQHQSLFQ